jgi:drug/metabolite transporter (DMT)-like permease
VRGVFASLLLLALMWGMGRLRDAMHVVEPRILLRAFLDFVATALFIAALFHLPLGDITAIQQAAPLAGALLAWVLLGERFGWRRMLAICVGFAGVLLIVRPGFAGFSAYMLLSIASMLGSAVRDVVTRRIATHVPSMAVALSNAVVVGVGGLAISLFEGFRPLSLETTGAIAVGALFLVGGYFFFVLAIRAGDIASTAPFRYTNILWALVAGYLVFGDVPDLAAFVGMALIAAAGLFALYRETRGLRR